MNKGHLLLLLILLMIKPAAIAQKTKFTKLENVPYGFVSGAALLMDVYQPENSNHLGVIYIIGSAFGSPAIAGDGEFQLRNFYHDTTYAGKWPQSLVEKGYTVFIIEFIFHFQHTTTRSS